MQILHDNVWSVGLYCVVSLDWKIPKNGEIQTISTWLQFFSYSPRSRFFDVDIGLPYRVFFCVFSKCENTASRYKVVNSLSFLTTKPVPFQVIFVWNLLVKRLVLSRKYKSFSLRLQSRAGEPLVGCFSINIIIFKFCCKLSMQRFFLPAYFELFHTFMFCNFFQSFWELYRFQCIIV